MFIAKAKSIQSVEQMLHETTESYNWYSQVKEKTFALLIKYLQAAVA